MNHHFWRVMALFCAVFGALVSNGWADGFIIVREPVIVPPHHFPFAPLEVKYHHVSVNIDGQIATTTVDESFYNPNPQSVEGTYLFPVPKLAQIDKFSMQVNGKEQEAELLDAGKARDIYEDIVRKLRDPALLEYADRSVFKVRIFPIEGHSDKQVKIVYSEVLKSDSGLVSYVYPLNTEKFSSAPIGDVSVTVNVSESDTLSAIYSPSQEVDVKRTDSTHAVVGYEAKNVRPNTDFQLYFSTKKSGAALDLVTYKTSDDDEGYFMLLASPGALTESKHLPKDVTFVLDTSGSMADDDKLVQAKKALAYCLANLNPDDRFEVIRFSTEPEQLFGKLTLADDKAVEEAQHFVQKMRPRGGTAIYSALHQAMGLRTDKSDRPYTIVFLTDGMPTVGETSEEAIVGETDEALKQGTRIFCFGMGTDVNAKLLDRIAENTHAVSDYVLPTEDIEVKVSTFFDKVKEPVLAQVKVNFPDGIRVTKMYPEPMPDLFKGDQVVVCGRYTADGSGDASLEGVTEEGKEKFTVPLTFPKESKDQPFVAKLWATRRVGYLLDQIRMNGENAEVKQEVTDLARQFGLVTPYTAYLIAEDEKTRNVGVNNRVMSDLDKDSQARDTSYQAYHQFQTQESGGEGVGAARAQNAMKNANNAADYDTLQNEASKTMNAPMGGVIRGGNFERSASSVDTAPTAEQRLIQYTLNQKVVAGRAVFLTGDEWVDSKVSKVNSDKVTTIKFGTDDYFTFISNHPDALPFLALGDHVKMALADGVYEVTP